jgi:plastocyanin
MPVWSDINGGPLNYIQIQNLIAFLRAPSTQTFVVRNAALNEPVIGPDGKVETFTGWVDPTYKPPPGATPFPACWSDAFATPSGSPGASGSPAASADANATHVKVTAMGIAFTTPDITAPAGKAFVIDFDNEDAGTPHNIQIKDSTGAVKFTGATFNGVATKPYDVPALDAGSYPFQCTVHPTMTGTLTVK